MNWLRAILYEVKLVIKMTFVDPVRARKFNDPGWMSDRHLRNGFFIGAPLFILGVVLTLPTPLVGWFGLGWAVLSNLCVANLRGLEQVESCQVAKHHA